MPSELRILRFRLEEVAVALRSLAPRIELAVPPGPFTIAAPAKNEEAPSTVFGINGAEDRITVTNGTLAASLILHCQTGGVKLPRQGNKEIYVSAKFIELRVAVPHRYINEDVVPAVQLEV